MKQLILLMKFLLLVHRDKLLPQLMLMMSCFPSLLINLIVHNWTMKIWSRLILMILEEMDLKWAGGHAYPKGEEILKESLEELISHGKELLALIKTMVECYNCHRIGHFVRKCRAPRNQGNRNGDAPRRIVLVETPTNALVVQDGIGSYDWSFQAEEGLTNFALMAYTSQVVNSVFNSKESDVDDSPVNDRFKTGEGFHAVPPPYTRNYMPLRPDLSFTGLDDSVYKAKDLNTVMTKPKFTKINFVKSDENVKSVNKENTHRQEEYPRKSQSPRDNRRNWNGIMTQKLGNGFEFIKKACFVCGSFNHLIKDCDFHDKKIVEKPVLNNKGRVTAVVTKSGQVPVNVAKQSSPRAASSISTARPVNTAAPKSKVNDELPNISYFKAHSLVTQHAGLGGPTGNVFDHTSKIMDHTCLKDLTVLIYQGRLIRNKSFLTDYQRLMVDLFALTRSPKTRLLEYLTSESRKVEENMHIKFLENKPNVAGSGPEWLFDIDLLTNSMNYEPVTVGNQTNKNADKDANGNSIYRMFTPVNVAGSFCDNLGGSILVNAATLPNADLPTDPLMPDLEDTGIFSGAYDDEDVGAEADLNNLETTMNLHPKAEENKLQRLSKLLICLFSLTNRTQEGKHAIGTKWVYRNKKDERGKVVRNKARLVAQGYTQEEGIDYDEVFAPVARIEAIRLFLTYASFMGFIVYQMDVKSAFLYGTIKKEVYLCQPPGFEDPQFPNKVYKVEKALDGLHQAPRAWYETLSTYLLENGIRRGIIDKTLFIKKEKGDILLV
ncbi:putative ribonuclease H-like domain-containing protein [Tanacetum coccineum]